MMGLILAIGKVFVIFFGIMGLALLFLFILITITQWRYIWKDRPTLKFIMKDLPSHNINGTTHAQYHSLTKHIEISLPSLKIVTLSHPEKIKELIIIDSIANSICHEHLHFIFHEHIIDNEIKMTKYQHEILIHKLGCGSGHYIVREKYIERTYNTVESCYSNLIEVKK